MIKYGTNNIGKIYFGSNPIGKAYFGSNLVYSSGPGPVLPYDARVEYIGFTGTQYVNTLIYPTSMNLDIRYYSYTALLYGWVSQNVAAKVWIACEGPKSLNVWWSTWFTKYQLSSSTQTSWHNYRYDMSSGFYMDDSLLQSFTSSLPAGTSISSVPLYIGVTYDTTAQVIETTSPPFDTRLRNMKIYQGGTLVRDFIAVRVGQVGYLYDKVSGELFGNSGTGSFTIGSDV